MVSRPSLSKPNLLFSVRCFQLAFALAFLIVISYSSVHRGWWNNITGDIAIGVITSILTLAICAHALFTHIRSNPFSSRGAVFQIARLALEALTFLLWVATAVLMFRHKGGCEGERAVTEAGITVCYYDDKHWKLHSDRPQTPWFVGTAFDLVEWCGYFPCFLLWFGVC